LQFFKGIDGEITSFLDNIPVIFWINPYQQIIYNGNGF